MTLYSRAKHFFWVLANLYARVFGRARLARFHEALIIFFLHGLGYDNGWKARWTGEEWFVREILAPSHPRVAIDVGANVGDYSKLLLTHTQAAVYAFEPAQATFTELSKIQSERFFPIQSAVSDAVGTGVLYSPREKSPTASLDASLVAHASSENIAITTLDTFAGAQKLSHIDFIKVDVEGFEREVFLGMQKVLAMYTPRYIQFEFNRLQLDRGYTLLTLAKMLTGYRLYRLLPNGWIEIDPTHFANNIFMFCNIVAVRALPTKRENHV